MRMTNLNKGENNLTYFNHILTKGVVILAISNLTIFSKLLFLSFSSTLTKFCNIHFAK